MTMRTFEILDQLNLEDEKNGTRNVALSNVLISADKVKAGGHVKMGVDSTALNDLMSSAFGSDTHFAVLLVINKKKFKEAGGS